MRRYRLLDLCCCGGGASEGYVRSGFMVHGIDIESQPDYPYTFTRCDALEYVRANGHLYDAIHASPPCQDSTWSARRWINAGKEYRTIDFVELRQALEATGKPFVIENTNGAPLRKENVFWLSGLMFGLPLIRDRQFESNVFLLGLQKAKKQGSVKNRDYVTVAGHGGDGSGKLSDYQRAMDISWLGKDTITQAIPPAYTEFIGRQLIRYLEYNQVKAELAV